MRKLLKENGLSLVVFAFFFLFWGAQAFTGYEDYLQELKDHGRAQEISFSHYLKTGHFIEATFENWESEFLQMGIFVVMTSFLYQKGSPESKSLEKKAEVDQSPEKKRNKKEAPWPVRKGGWVLALYKNSLSLVFFLLFFISFLLHAWGGAREYAEQQTLHGSPEQADMWNYMKTSHFWFESFQNWQSEFLAVGGIVVFSIFLRQVGSAQSKPVDSPNWKNE